MPSGSLLSPTWGFNHTQFLKPHLVSLGLSRAGLLGGWLSLWSGGRGRGGRVLTHTVELSSPATGLLIHHSASPRLSWRTRVT